MDQWQSLDAFLIANGVTVGAPTLGQTTGGQHSKTSGHPQKRSRDYGNVWPYSDCHRIVEVLKPYVGPGSPIEELYYTPTNTWFDSGVVWRNPPKELVTAHKSHVHVTLWKGRMMPVVMPKPPFIPSWRGPVTSIGDQMKRQEMRTGSLDEAGNGYHDTGIPFEKLVSIIPLGPSPDRDGYGWPNWYWAANNTNAQARIEIEGGEAHKPVGFVAVFAD